MKSKWFINKAFSLFEQAQTNGLNTNWVFTDAINVIRKVLEPEYKGNENAEELILKLEVNDFLFIRYILDFILIIYEHISKHFSLDDDQYSDLINDYMFVKAVTDSISEKYCTANKFIPNIIKPLPDKDIILLSAALLMESYPPYS